MASPASSVKVMVRPMRGEGDIIIYISIMSRALRAPDAYAAFLPLADVDQWIAANLTVALQVRLNAFSKEISI